MLKKTHFFPYFLFLLAKKKREKKGEDILKNQVCLENNCVKPTRHEIILMVSPFPLGDLFVIDSDAKTPNQIYDSLLNQYHFFPVHISVVKEYEILRINVFHNKMFYALSFTTTSLNLTLIIN